MFLLCEIDNVYETVHLLGVFDNKEDAEKACSWHDDVCRYYVDECPKFTCGEDYLVNLLEDMYREKSCRAESLYQDNERLTKAYNDKVREVEEVRQLLEKYREKVKQLEEQNNS